MSALGTLRNRYTIMVFLDFIWQQQLIVFFGRVHLYRVFVCKIHQEWLKKYKLTWLLSTTAVKKVKKCFVDALYRMQLSRLAPL